MDFATFNGFLLVASNWASHAFGKLRTAVKAEEAINDQPKLRKEFEAHKVDDQSNHATILTTLARIEGSLEVVKTDVGWLKDQRKDK